MESLNVYKNGTFREYKYSPDISAILMNEYIRDGYFLTEDADVVLAAEKSAAISAAMAKLSSRERLIIQRFMVATPGEPWLINMANAMDVHPIRIKQIRDKALKRIRFYLEKKKELWVEETTEEDV